MTQPTQVIMAGVDTADSDNWRLKNYLKRDGYAALKKNSFTEKFLPRQ